MLIFLHPWVGWLLPAPLLVHWLVPPRVVSTVAIRVPFMDRLKQVGCQPQRSNKQHRATILAWAVWIIALTALARPQWLAPPIEKTVPTRDLFVLVDLSASMQHEDFQDADGKPVDRLTIVKELLGDFLAEREGDRMGLVVFGNAPFLQVPLTTDLSLCERLLEETQVGMAGPRTALGDAIGLGIRLLEESDSPDKTLLLVTDGNDTSSALPPIEAARVARDREITIHTIAIGDPESVGEEKLDEATLRDVAQTADGEFFLALDRSELAGVYERINEIETSEAKTISHRPRTDLYYWPLAAALLLSMLAPLRTIASTDGETVRGSTSRTRLRVNRTTFELEASEE